MKEASTLQIRLVVFPPGKCTSPQLHPCHRLFDLVGHQDSHPPYSSDLAPGDFWLFPKLRGCRYETIEEMKEAVTKVIDMLTQEDFHGASQKLLEQYNNVKVTYLGIRSAHERVWLVEEKPIWLPRAYLTRGDLEPARGNVHVCKLVRELTNIQIHTVTAESETILSAVA